MGHLRSDFDDSFALHQYLARFHDVSVFDIEQPRGMQHDWVLRLGGREGTGQKKTGQGREELWLFHGSRKDGITRNVETAAHLA